MSLTKLMSYILLESSGYSLSHSIKMDVIIEYMIQNKIYSLTTKLLDVLHIPYNWHQANDPDFAIDKAKQHLNKNKSRDDFER